MSDEDLVDLVRSDPGVFQRLDGDLPDQRLDVVAFMLAERRMAPANDTGGHPGSPLGRVAPCVSRRSIAKPLAGVQAARKRNRFAKPAES